MADVKQIEVNGVTYDIHDAVARQQISDLQDSVSYKQIGASGESNLCTVNMASYDDGAYIFVARSAVVFAVKYNGNYAATSIVNNQTATFSGSTLSMSVHGCYTRLYMKQLCKQ